MAQSTRPDDNANTTVTPSERNFRKDNDVTMSLSHDARAITGCSDVIPLDGEAGRDVDYPMGGRRGGKGRNHHHHHHHQQQQQQKPSICKTQTDKNSSQTHRCSQSTDITDNSSIMNSSCKGSDLKKDGEHTPSTRHDDVGDETLVTKNNVPHTDHAFTGTRQETVSYTHIELSESSPATQQTEALCMKDILHIDIVQQSDTDETSSADDELVGVSIEPKRHDCDDSERPEKDFSLQSTLDHHQLTPRNRYTGEKALQPRPNNPENSMIPRIVENPIHSSSGSMALPFPASLRKNMTLPLHPHSPSSVLTSSSPASVVALGSVTMTHARPGRLGYGGQCEIMSVLSAPSSPSSPTATMSGVAVSRDTVTSRLRMEKRHQNHLQALGQGDTCRSYLTPSQRKAHAIKDLKAQVQHLTQQLQNQEQQVQHTWQVAQEEKEEIQRRLQGELEEAQAMAETARQEVTYLQETHEASVKMAASLQQQLEDAKKEMERRLTHIEDVFLEMYKKGRESAVFEREEELELQGKGDRKTDATEAELRNKLVRTQAELAKWQTLQRHESYHATDVPATEAETTLRFLKDSVFHFLTSDKKKSQEHLRAMVNILRFSEFQKEKIRGFY